MTALPAVSQPGPLGYSRLAVCLSRFFPVLLGVALTLTLRGYQFGGGNHTVYLIAPLREIHPELLQKDWWTTHTLQYHLAYTQLTAVLMRLHMVEGAFLVFYIGLMVLLHVGWLRIVLAVGLDARTYLLSVLLYYLSAGGTGLGSYQFMQDSCFLPGNVANVALLWGIAFWVEGRAWRSAGCFAVAGLFHLNHALLALAFWPVGMVFLIWRGRAAGEKNHGRAAHATSCAVGGFGLILLLALPNIIPAARVAFTHGPKMPLKEFVDLYVHLRHPHHYDPLTWPPALWISFLWPIPLAAMAYRRMKRSAVGDGSGASPLRRSAFCFSFFVAFQIIALLFTGVLFISEPLIQMSLFRFSIYPKLLSCIGAAAFLLDPGMMARRALRLVLLGLPSAALIALLGLRLGRPGSVAGLFVQANLPALLLFIALLGVGVAFVLRSSAVVHRSSSILVVLLLGTLLLAWNGLGLRLTLQDDGDRDYLAVCDFARQHTPVEAVFLVPPNEQLFRFHAQRGIVVNFKNVPQLSREMGEWKERLEAVLGQPLSVLPRRFDLAHQAIAARYDLLPFDHLAGIARRYSARYLVTTQALADRRALFENASYHLYDLFEWVVVPRRE